ncbi:hypothetical protein V493_06824 [Pseudogymnoascus sp. VKM F-4281 (FW-2241)]|nr:hypothetical protein V493_06824 [Pseudogymnoascus sp. VKM F-4281 (FW-2241)]
MSLSSSERRGTPRPIDTSFAQLGDYPSTYPTHHTGAIAQTQAPIIAHSPKRPSMHTTSLPTDAYPYSTAPHHYSGTPQPAPPSSAPPAPSLPPDPPPATPTIPDETSPAPSAAHPSPPDPSAAAAAAQTTLLARYPAPLVWHARSCSCSSPGVAHGTQTAP